MSNLELRIEEEASLNLTLGESSDMSFDAVDFVGVPFAPTVEVEDIEGGHRVSITSMGAEGKKTDEFDVMDGADGATWLNGNVLIGEIAEGTVLTADDAYAAPPKGVSVFGKSTQAGTPTPDAPVAIQSVDELNIHANDTHGVMWWNQTLDPIVKTEVMAVGITLKVESDGKFSYTGTTTSTGGRLNYVASNINIVSGHKYLLLDTATYDDLSSNWYLSILTTAAVYATLTPNTIFTASGNATCGLGKNLDKAYKTYNLSGYVSLYDITAMFGAGNEPSTVAEFKAMFPEPYYPYDAGSWIDSDNWPVSIPMQGYALCSLPDGTRDSLTLSYVAPSTEHEGWGVFSKTLVQRVGVATINASEWQNQPVVSIGDGWYRTVKDVLHGAESVVRATATQGMCTAAPFVYNTTLKSEHVGTQNMYILLVAQESTAVAIAARYDGATVIYKLAAPVTTDLGTVELPVNPAPDLTAWADGGSAQPTLAMEYERSLSIVIPRIEDAIADMATS